MALTKRITAKMAWTLNLGLMMMASLSLANYVFRHTTKSDFDSEHRPKSAVIEARTLARQPGAMVNPGLLIK